MDCGKEAAEEGQDQDMKGPLCHTKLNGELYRASNKEATGSVRKHLHRSYKGRPITP